MQQSVVDLVRLRAGGRCEYCQLSDDFAFFPFELDHIIARKHRGGTVESNLALSCTYCNSHKGSNIAGLDPHDERLSRLFNPRTDDWSNHFQWKGGELVGLTPEGRTTIYVLNINDPNFVAVREQLIDNGEFPPTR